MRSDDAPNVGSQSLEDEIAGLQGEAPFIDQDAILEADEVEGERVPTLSETEWGVPASAGLRTGETDDPTIAAEEGQTYIPPSDPPFVASDDPDGVVLPGAHTASAEGDVNARIRAALAADAATTGLAERVQIAVVGSTAILRGTVDGIEDTDALVEVVGRVDGIDEVRDETEVPGL